MSPPNRSAIARPSALLPLAVGPRTATTTGSDTQAIDHEEREQQRQQHQALLL
jgi:hypothetical protein